MGRSSLRLGGGGWQCRWRGVLVTTGQWYRFRLSPGLPLTPPHQGVRVHPITAGQAPHVVAGEGHLSGLADAVLALTGPSQMPRQWVVGAPHYHPMAKAEVPRGFEAGVGCGCFLWRSAGMERLLSKCFPHRAGLWRNRVSLELLFFAGSGWPF